MYTAHNSTQLFRDNYLRCQVPTWTSTLACTLDQFRSSWRPGPNHTRWCRWICHSSSKALAEERHPSRHLAEILRSYQSWFWALLYVRTSQPLSLQPLCLDDGTQRERGPEKGIPRTAGLASSSLSLRSRGSKVRRQGAILPDWTLYRESLRALPVPLQYCLRVVVHHANPFAKLLLESGGFQKCHQEPMVNAIEGLELIQIDQRGFGAVF